MLRAPVAWARLTLSALAGPGRGRWPCRETRRAPLVLSTYQGQVIYLATGEPGLGIKGALIGQEDASGGAFVYDAFELYGPDLPAPNAFVFGDPGNGKSALLKTYPFRMMRFGAQVAVLDSKDQQGQGEYARLAQVMGVRPVRLRPGAPDDPAAVRINPLDPRIPLGRQQVLLRTLGEVLLDRRLG